MRPVLSARPRTWLPNAPRRPRRRSQRSLGARRRPFRARHGRAAFRRCDDVRARGVDPRKADAAVPGARAGAAPPNRLRLLEKDPAPALRQRGRGRRRARSDQRACRGKTARRPARSRSRGSRPPLSAPLLLLSLLGFRVVGWPREAPLAVSNVQLASPDDGLSHRRRRSRPTAGW